MLVNSEKTGELYDGHEALMALVALKWTAEGDAATWLERARLTLAEHKRAVSLRTLVVCRDALAAVRLASSGEGIASKASAARSAVGER